MCSLRVAISEFLVEVTFLVDGEGPLRKSDAFSKVSRVARAQSLGWREQGHRSGGEHYAELDLCARLILTDRLKRGFAK